MRVKIAYWILASLEGLDLLIGFSLFLFIAVVEVNSSIPLALSCRQCGRFYILYNLYYTLVFCISFYVVLFQLIMMI